MATQGQHTVGCITSLSAAARLAAASSCHVAGLQPPNAARAPVRGGGAAASYGPTVGQPVANRLAAATQAQCVAAGHHALPGAGPDPALVALGVLLGSAAPPAAPPSLGQRLASQLSNLAALLQVATGRVSALLPTRGGEVATVADTIVDARPADAAQPAPPPRVPMQPPGPTLTMDASLGIVVEIEPEGGTTAGPGIDEPEIGLPSSWVPVTAPLLNVAERSRRAMGSLFARIDDILDAARMSRLQLLLLLLLAPPAVVFLIDVVSSMLGG